MKGEVPVHDAIMALKSEIDAFFFFAFEFFAISTLLSF